jgi:hypothetical protein
VVAAHESGLNPNAKNAEGSASGLYQYISQTWNSKIQQFAGGYNISPSSSPFDIKASTIVAGASVKEDTSIMGSIQSPVTYLDLYLTHFLGSGGGPSFMRHMLENPSANAVNSFPEQAQWNPEFFYQNSQPLSFKGVYETIGASFDTAAKSFGLKGRSTDIIGGHGAKAKPTTDKPKPSTNLKKVTKTITKKSKDIKNAKTVGAPTSQMGLPSVAAPSSIMPTVAQVDKATHKAPAVAKKHVSTPNVVNLGDEHAKLVARVNKPKGQDHISVQTNHLSDISASNSDIKNILHQQLLVQNQTLQYLKQIANNVNKAKAPTTNTAGNTKAPTVNAPVKPVEPKPVVRPVTVNNKW